jgi:hypothetical protein
MKNLLIICCIIISLWSCSDESVTNRPAVPRAANPALGIIATDESGNLLEDARIFLRNGETIIPLERLPDLNTLKGENYELIVSRPGYVSQFQRLSGGDLAKGNVTVTMKKGTLSEPVYFLLDYNATYASFRFEFKKKAEIELNWGDATETISGKKAVFVEHYYPADGNYNAGEISGDVAAITALEITGGISSFSFSPMTMLQKLVLRDEYMYDVNLTDNTRLTHLDLTNLRLVGLFLPSTHSLESISLAGMSFLWGSQEGFDPIIQNIYTNAVNHHVKGGSLDIRNLTAIDVIYDELGDQYVYSELHPSAEAIALLNTLRDEYGWSVQY